MSENQNENDNEPAPSVDNNLVQVNTPSASQSSEPPSGEEPLVLTRREILDKLRRLTGLVAVGLISTAKANSMRAIYSTMLANLGDSSQAGAAVLKDEDALKILRESPGTLNLLEPFLTPDQVAMIAREASND